MNSTLTEIAFILDRSGSMSSMATSAIESFNTFLTDQEQAQGTARLTLVLFDDEYDVIYLSLPVYEATLLDKTTYEPRGSTALLDAIGRTIDDLNKRLSSLPEAARPGKVIVVILTDGLENSSVDETWTSISKRIRHHTREHAWEFLFLGANQDAIATAAQLHIAAKNAATYHADAIGFRSTARSISDKAKALRAKAAGLATPMDEHVAAAPLQHIVQQEDRKQRRKS